MGAPYNLSQLTAEVRAAMPDLPIDGLKRSGGDAYPEVVPTDRTHVLTTTQQATFTQVCDAHVPDKHFGETAQQRADRLTLDAALADVTVPEWGKALIRLVRGLA